MTDLVQAGQVTRNFWIAACEPGGPLLEPRQSLVFTFGDHQTCEDRKQTYERANLEASSEAIGKAQHVVVKTIILVIKFVQVDSHAVHRSSDLYEMLVEL